MIAIVDYGAGNLHSVVNALNFIGAPCSVCGDAASILAADGVILPGVGSFGAAAADMEASGLSDAVRGAAVSGKPFLGICLGLQLLFSASEESPGAKGLGILEGEILRIPSEGVKVPHMGWNSLDIKGGNALFEGVESGAFVYFVHSYYLRAAQPGIVAATTRYGVSIDAAVCRDSLFATQFHPEKSGKTGIRMLRNFVRLCERGV